MPKQNTSTSNGFQVSLEAAKDYLAHKKFTKASKLHYRGEMRRLEFPKGPDGWIQWRMQFTPRQGEDTSPVENELNRLHDQRKLNDDEYARLRGLYGLDGHATAQVPPSVLTQPSQAGFCAECGNQILLGEEFCRKCGTPVTPTSQLGREQTGMRRTSSGSTVAQPHANIIYCMECGTPSPTTNQFCRKCSTKLE